jgi:hypothetical protein
MLLRLFATVTTGALIVFHTIVGGLIVKESGLATVPHATSTIATSTVVATVASSTATTTPKQPATKKTTAKHIVSETQPVATPTAPVVQPTINPEALNSEARGALVNILCETQSGGSVHSISGSGIFVDSRGVILTNAHIGQYFLLKDYPTPGNVDCRIRTGSPAQPMYRATLLYLPLQWVIDNASQLVAETAKGTGENDYAFLVVTSSVGPTPLPASYPNLPMTNDEPDTGESMLLAAYPAGFLDINSIEKNLYPTSAYAVVKDLYTFSNVYDTDLVSIGGTVVSQGGSSGGAAVRASDGKLQGLIATATTADTTAGRDLRAITLAHIERSLVTYNRGGIPGLLLQDLNQAMAKFASTTAPAELQLLIAAIKK